MKSRFLVATFSLVLLSIAPPLWAKSYNNKSLKGTYAERFTGSVGTVANPFPAGTAVPQSGTGTETADGKGNFSANLVFSIGGSTCSGTVTGTYVVNPDGTGTSTGTFTPNATPPSGLPAGNYSCPTQLTGTQDEAFTIVGGGTVNFISTDADSVVTGTAQLQK
jgi:hypothetical protein